MTAAGRTTPVLLVVDDHEAGRFAKSSLLRRAGFEVEEAATGAEALRSAAEIDPDVVVLDVHLPDISGHEVCRRLKAGRPVPAQVLQVSATAVAEEDLVAGLAHGADTYLIEPVPPEVLLATTRALLRVRRTERALFELAERERAAREDAERANRSKDEFLATLSHELRTPLNAMTGWLWQLRRVEDPDARARALDALERNLRMQARLIDDLLDISRIEKGKIELALQPVDLRTLVAESVDAIHGRAGSREIETRLPAEPAIVVADRERLMQVLGNLLNNALQFTPADGRIGVALESAGDTATLVVEDTGRGIDPAFLPYVFESFRQAEAGSTRRSGGLGLGLAIVKRLVELQGGSIEASSGGIGQGAAFVVRLPLATTAQLEPAADRDDSHPRLEDVQILVVEDDPDARDIIGAMLQAAGAAVTEAASAADALNAIQDRPFDVLVSDIAMAGRDGLDLMRTVRAMGIGIPSIAVTALSTDDDRRRCAEAGFTQHLGKPVDQQLLISRIASLLSPRPARS